MDTPKTIRRSILSRAFAERAHYAFDITGRQDEAGKMYLYCRAQRVGEPNRSYDIRVEFDQQSGKFIPDGCNCPWAQAHPTEHCKHIVAYMIVTGQISDDLRRQFDPEWITETAKKRKAA